MSPKHKKLYMDMAKLVAQQSYAERAKVGAVAVKEHRVLSIGYNGTTPGSSNVCEGHNDDGSTYTLDSVIHAEKNLIYKMARDGQSAKEADLFVTIAPCYPCSLGIVASGFKKVYFGKFYRDSRGIDELIKCGVEVERLDE